MIYLLLMAKLFPDDFLWGASTAGHQVEGGNYDQWTVWELAHAKELAKGVEERIAKLPEWQRIKIPPEAKLPDNYVSGKGVDHFHRYKEDFDILESLGLNAFRFTLEWSRLEPEEGVWDKGAFDHYHNYIAELKKRRIEPVLNLWHWTHPVWFEDKGAFGKSGNTGFFLRFASKVAEEFGDEVKYIITLNEPNIYISYPELNAGVPVPPQATLPQRLLMYLRLIKVHKMTYLILKKANPDLQIGAAVQMANNLQKHESFLSGIAVKLADKFGNYYFYDRIIRKMDFVGFNYYFTNYWNGLKIDQPYEPKSDLGFYMEPAGVGEVATKLWVRYHKPVMVTENGLADATDEHRQWWLKETMLSLISARKAGVHLIGYLHWSLLDNFEWAFGWWPKFGLVHVDREHGMKRTVRPSARWWAKQIAHIRSQNNG
jgi:beta-glucosidase